MTLKQCYDKIGGNYEAVMDRLGSEAMVRRFALKFQKDPSFWELIDGFAKKDAEIAFRAAHTLKGVCMNLGFDRLAAPVYALTENLRGRTFSEESNQLFSDVAKEYRLLIAALGEIDQ